MFRRVLILTAIVLIFTASNLQAVEIIDSNWVGGSGSWGDPCNWEPPIVPDNNELYTFSVTIDGGSGDKKQVKISSFNRAIDQLDCYGNVWLEKPPLYDIELTLADANGLTNYGNLRIRGGTYNELPRFKILGSVGNESDATLELFGVKIENAFYNAPRATVEMAYENSLHGGVQNDGTIIIYPASEMGGDANIINAGEIQIFGGVCAITGQLFNDLNGVIEGFGVFHSNESIENSGTIYASGGAFSVHTDSFLSNTGTLGNSVGATLHITTLGADPNNQGAIEIGAIGAVTFSDHLKNEPNGVIELLGGALSATTITQTADANFAGFGGITGDVFIDPNGIIKLTGPTNIVGDVNIPAGATLEISDGQTLITGHTICNGTIHLIGGTVIFQGGCDCDDCNIINEAGIDRNHFDINADGIENFEDFASFANTWLWQASWY